MKRQLNPRKYHLIGSSAIKYAVLNLNFYLCENLQNWAKPFHKLDINGITMRNCWITKCWEINFI